MPIVINIIKILPSIAELLYVTIKILSDIVRHLAKHCQILNCFIENPLWQYQPYMVLSNHETY